MSARTWRTSFSSCCSPPTTISNEPSAASSISTKSTRSVASPITPRSPATCRARACSRRSSRSWKGPSPRCLRRAAASTPSRSSCRSTPPTSCSYAAALLAALRRSSRPEVGQPRSVSGPRCPDRKTGEIFREVEPEDLLKYGLIPEFVGRLPVLATLEDLDEPTLKRILVEPKNALVKQYHRLFEMERIDLSFAEEALGAIARKAIERKTGARGLRSIMESILLDTMFDLPSLEGIQEVVISKQVVDRTAPPLYIYADRSGRVGSA